MRNDMRNQALVVASAALMMAAVVVVVALVAFNIGTQQAAAGHAAQNRSIRPVAQTTEAGNARRPVPTVTITRPQAPPSTVVVPPPSQSDPADQTFLELIAGDGIKAPDDWAIEAGRKTCGKSYSYAYRYLTEGGIYSYHVQTFLDDWLIAHGGC